MKPVSIFYRLGKEAKGPCFLKASDILAMLSKILFLLLINFAVSRTDYSDGFSCNGFIQCNMSLDGSAQITSNGLLQLTNSTANQMAHAFYSLPLQFKNTSNGTAFSFSTTFVFVIFPKYSDLSGHGLAFVISPSNGIPGAQGIQFMGLFNSTNLGNTSNHIVAVEFDTVRNLEFGFDDINNNHVGIDINGLKSVKSSPAAYYQNGELKNISLISGELLQVWVDYDGFIKQFNVTLSPLGIPKPNIPLLSLTIDLSPVIFDSMHVGFSSSTGTIVASHYVAGWSVKVNGPAPPLRLSQLPKLPRIGPKEKSKMLTIGLPLIITISGFSAMMGVFIILRRKIKYAEILEDWEHEYGPHRFSYKDLFIATKGFKDKELLGTGGFGMVYRGVLPASNSVVAVKRVSHNSRQGIKEFVAEIVTLGRLRHRNLVQLLGYCRRKGELLLVYDFMPNGSLDKLLFAERPKAFLNWTQRSRIIKGVAQGLLYLHEEWEKVILHRDVKASNVLLDVNYNGRLGDFGLARLYDHGTNPRTTHVVGTLGYIAPELVRRGRATTSTDVFAFGIFMLEVACGRRPTDFWGGSLEGLTLVDWVLQCWRRGNIQEAADRKLGCDYIIEEMELVLKLGLLCSHPISAARPRMRQVMHFLDGDVCLPELSPDCFKSSILGKDEGLDGLALQSCPFPSGASSSSIADSILSGGR